MGQHSEKNAKRGHSGQLNEFRKAAHALGCDEEPAHFDAALKKVARHKPLPDAPTAPKPERHKKPTE
jgi:hypothetical protein